MPALVALDLPGGPGFVDALRRVWERGDAAFPIDRRLPPAARAQVLRALAPGRVVDEHGDEHRVEGGRPVDPGDALVVPTSGTTGAPKGVVLTHEAVRASALATSARLAVDPARDRWLACLPLAHVGGLSVVTRALVTGTPLTVHDGFDAGAVEQAARAGCTLVSLVATALQRIDPDRFRVVVVGGGRPPAGLPAHCVTTYGMTETGSGVVYDGVPLDGVELRCADDGEVWLRGPMLLRAYRDGTDPKDAAGWLATGDLGAIDPSGRLVVHGRRGDVVVTGGEKVWPDPVEAVLRTVPGVRDVAVIGRPDPDWGQVVVAVVEPDGDPPALDALRTAVKAVLPPWCAPRALEVVASLPRTALGKVRRADLAARSGPADRG
jgi:O-succinylbenzoic acid--CoA ligase